MDDLSTLITYAAAFIFIVALIGVIGWIVKSVLGGGSVAGGLLRRGERRLGVVEHASVDSRRRLVLVRRDNVEHLIMIGGPVDMLIEAGINNAGATSFRPQDRLDLHRDDRTTIAERPTTAFQDEPTT